VDATLHVDAGECLALLGPNGAGKTTLIRAVTGRLALDSGTITVGGQAVHGVVPQRNAHIGLVPQDLAIYPLLTARENLLAFGRLQGLIGATLAARVDEALDWSGLTDRASSLARGFSGGMKRRLNIAAAVLHQPSLLLLDEPTVGVDPQSRAKIWQMVAQQRERGCAVLLTTHQLDEAQQICSRISILDEGRTIADGTFEELIDRTIGRRRRVRVAVAGEVNGSAIPPGFECVDSGHVEGFVTDVARELPLALSTITGSGRIVTDVHLESLTLQAVFLHLTGRELRE